MAKDRKNNTPQNGDITPRVLSEMFDTTPYKIRKVLRQHAGELEHAKNSRWSFTPDSDELTTAINALSEKYGEPNA